MENASKALGIAGGVLIAIMLTVLVYYVFTHWGDSQALNQEDLEIQKVEEFNKSYLSYEKVLYGSELLGLVNKMNDYNNSDEVNYKGYGKMDLNMNIKELSGTTDNLFSSGNYNLLSSGSNNILNVIQNVLDASIDNNLFKGKISDSQWEYLAKGSSRSFDNFKELCQKLNVNVSENNIEKLQDASKEYYKYIQFKRMKFKNTETTFFDNGRVKSMSFEETK